MTPAIEIRDVEVRFGALVAIVDVSTAVMPGERRALIGPNGAGKTTLFNILSGELRPARGRVFVFGQDVTALPPDRRAHLGIGRTFQRNNVFLNLTALENVRLAAQIRDRRSHDLWRPASRYAELADEAAAALEQVGLKEKRGVRAADLSYGEARQLELAVALATRPTVLLLDEPTAGMSPAETARMTQLLASLPRETTLVIIEHDMDVVQQLADRITVLHSGEVVADGPAEEVRANPRVQEVYLGEVGGGVA